MCQLAAAPLLTLHAHIALTHGAQTLHSGIALTHFAHTWSSDIAHTHCAKSLDSTIAFKHCTYTWHPRTAASHCQYNYMVLLLSHDGAHAHTQHCCCCCRCTVSYLVIHGAADVTSIPRYIHIKHTGALARTWSQPQSLDQRLSTSVKQVCQL